MSGGSGTQELKFFLSVSTPSRHPANQDGYDSIRHRYLPIYVQPEAWILAPAVVTSAVFDPGVRSVRFMVRGADFPFETTATVTSSTGANEGQGKEGLWRTRIAVPRPGTYAVSALVTMDSGGRFELGATRFSFRVPSAFTPTLADDRLSG